MKETEPIYVNAQEVLNSILLEMSEN